MNEFSLAARDWLASVGEIASFTGRIVRDVWSLRVLRFFGEGVRQAGILIASSTAVLWIMVFIIGSVPAAYRAPISPRRRVRRRSPARSLPGAACARQFPMPSGT